MDSGTKVYRAYIGTTPEHCWVDEGVVTEVLVNGQPLVRIGKDVLTPYADGWRATRTAARRDIHVALIRHIGEMQARADKLADELLHEELTTG